MYAIGFIAQGISDFDMDLEALKTADASEGIQFVMSDLRN